MNRTIRIPLPFWLRFLIVFVPAEILIVWLNPSFSPFRHFNERPAVEAAPDHRYSYSYTIREDQLMCDGWKEGKNRCCMPVGIIGSSNGIELSMFCTERVDADYMVRTGQWTVGETKVIRPTRP